MLEKRCIKFIWNFFNCTHELHKTVAIYSNTGCTLIDASVNIPSTKQNKKHKIPGWNENVQHSKEIALF